MSPKFHFVFALRSFVFQIIEVFGFPIAGYNGEFEIFEKTKKTKKQQIQIPNVDL